MNAMNPAMNGQAPPQAVLGQAPAGQAVPTPGQDQGMGMVDPNLLQAVMQGIQGTDVWQQQQSILQQLQSAVQQLQPLLAMLAPMQGGAPGGMPGMGAPGMGAPGMGGMDPMMLAAMMGGGMDQGMGDGDQDQDDDQGPPQDEPVRMDGMSPGFSVPTATNGFIPSAHTGNTRRQTPPRPGYMQQYNHQGQPVTTQRRVQTVPGQNGQQQLPQIPQVAQQVPQLPQTPVQHAATPETAEQALVRLQRRNQQLELENKQLRILFELGALQQEGLELDPQEELPILIQLDDNARAVQYQRMRQRYKNRNERAGLLPGMAQVPGVPGAAPGLGQPVPQQYQRGYQGQPRPEPPPTREEQEQVIQTLCEMRDAGQPMDYQAALHLVRYGRRRRQPMQPAPIPGQEQVY